MAVSSHETPWLSPHFVTPPGEAQEDLPHATNTLAIEDMLPKNVDIVMKPCTKVEGLARDSYSGHRAILFPGADGELLVFMGVKEIFSECTTRQASSGMLGGPHQTAVASRYAGCWTQLFLESMWDPFTKEAFEKDIPWNPRNTQEDCTSEEAHHQEGAKGSINIHGYTGSVHHSPELVLLRNAMEDLPPERQQYSLAAFAETGDTDAVNNDGGEEHCRTPCTASSDQVCQINDCLPIRNELVLDIDMQLRKQHGTSLTSFCRSKCPAVRELRSAASRPHVDCRPACSPSFNLVIFGGRLQNHPRGKLLCCSMKLNPIEGTRSGGQLDASKPMPSMAACQVLVARSCGKTKVSALTYRRDVNVASHG